MRSVNRTEKPQILIDNEQIWTTELLMTLNKMSEKIPLKDQDRREQINFQCVVSKVSSTISTRYSHDSIRLALQKMYEKRCCYCEGKISAQTYDHIEHLCPKSLFPHLTFEWENLHCCCEVCNKKKGDKWDQLFPILDPTKDCLEQYLDLDLNNGKIINLTRDKRAQNTIEHTQLNRADLVEERKAIIQKYHLIFKRATNLNQLELAKQYIEFEMMYSSYPTLHQKILGEIEKAIHEG